MLPDLRDGEALDLAGVTAEQHFTQPPPRFTEATLIKALEEHGIGRPSTYAPTIETIRARGYVTIKERRLFPEESAFRVTDLLVEHFPEVVDIEFTAKMEEQLDEVAAGTNEWVPMVRAFWDPFSIKIADGRANIAKQVELTDIVCPVSGDLHGQALRAERLVPRLLGVPRVQAHDAAPRRGGRCGGAARGRGGVPRVREGAPRGAGPAASARSSAATATPTASTSSARRRPPSGSGPARSAASARS